ncbi:hypothetical protein LPJ57_002576, partial [Coemansia sp. RSA 486]
NRVLRAHYPNDRSIGTNIMHVRIMDFSLVGTTSDEEAKALLRAYAQTSVNFNMVGDHSYCLYTSHLCTIIENGLRIQKIVERNGIHYVQEPPTANYVLHYLGKPIFEVAWHKSTSSRFDIEARCRIMKLLSQLLVLKEDPTDPVRPTYLNTMISIIRRETVELEHVQAVLPVSKDITLVLSETELRHSAYEALSALIAYSGYYYSIKRSDLIRDRDGHITDAFTKSIAQYNDNVEFSHYNSAIRDIISKAMTFLHQYSMFSPDFVQVFVEFYIEQLQNTRDDKLATVYIYGLIQAAMVTWKNRLSGKHYTVVFTALVHGLSNCDKNLKRHTQWSQYHQVFISSIRCLSIWMSAAPSHTQYSPEVINELMALLRRCNAFMRTSILETPIKAKPLGRKFQVTSSIETTDSLWYPDFTAKLFTTTAKPGFQNSEGDKDLYITSYSAVDVLSTTDRVSSDSASKNKFKEKPKKRVLSDSLYKVLSTTISVYSMFILRGLDKYQYDPSFTPQDILLLRQVLFNKTVPDNNVILSGCGSQVKKLLKDYKPVSITFYSGYYRAIYSTINFKRFENGRWSDSISLNTSRYPSGSKLWVNTDTDPKAEVSADSSERSAERKNAVKDVCSCSDNDNKEPASNLTQPWIRMTEGVISRGPLRSTFDILDMSGHIRHVRPIVDDEGELAMEQRTADEFTRLHSAKTEPDVEFARAKPPEFAPRGCKHIRTQLYNHQVIDWSFLNISESMLRELDFLDDLDRPFSALAGIVYLRSAESLTIERTKAKGPIKGISSNFGRFLASLSTNRSAPVERLKRYPDDPLLMRYSFTEQSFQVSYDLAPNVSSLISGSKMRHRDNEQFYKMLYDRGIYVMWFDCHQGDLDHQLAWQFLDSHYSAAVRKPPDVPTQEKVQPIFTQPTSYSRYPGLTPMSERPREKRELSVIGEGLKSATTQPEYTHFVLPAKGKQTSASPKAALVHSPGSDHGIHKNKAFGLFQKAVGKTRRENSTDNTHTLARTTSEPNSTHDAETTQCMPEEPKEQLRRNHQQHQPAQPPTDYSETLVGLKEALKMSIEKNTRSHFNKVHSGVKIAEAASTPTSPVFRSSAEDHTVSGFDPRRNGIQSEYGSPGSTCSDSANKIRVLIALAPIPHTGGRLVKINLSANGGSKQMNEDFIRMTGPLMPSMAVEAKNLASLLSATIMDASANIASLRCEDFSVVSKRVEMITSIIESFSVKHHTAGDAHKYMYPVGKSGVQNTFDIPCSAIDSGCVGDRNVNNNGDGDGDVGRNGNGNGGGNSSIDKIGCFDNFELGQQ